MMADEDWGALLDRLDAATDGLAGCAVENAAAMERWLRERAAAIEAIEAKRSGCGCGSTAVSLRLQAAWYRGACVVARLEDRRLELAASVGELSRKTYILRRTEGSPAAEHDLIDYEG